MNTLTFNDVNFNPVERNGQIWLTSIDLAKALGYKNTKSVSNLYSNNSDEFTDQMTLVIDSVTNGIGGSKRKMQVRVFSLRGCHAIGFFARTTVAKAFRKWVLDILDKEVGEPVQVNPITTISAAQQYAIRQAVAKKCKSVSAHYQTIYTKLYEYFNIPRYTELLAVDFDEAIRFIGMINMNNQNSVDYAALETNSHALSVHMVYCKQWFDSVKMPLEILNPEITRCIAGHFDEGWSTAKQINRSLCNM